MNNSTLSSFTILFSFMALLSFTIVSCGCDDATGETWYEDVDGDGKGNPNSFLTACDQPDGYVSDNSDEFDIPISKKQRAIFSYIGATWCPPCGEHGRPLLDYLESEVANDDKVVMTFHVGDLVVPTSSTAFDLIQDFTDHVDLPSVPYLYVAGGDYQDSRRLTSDHDNNHDLISSDISSIQNQFTNVGVGASARIDSEDDNRIIVETGLEFLGDTNEEYFIGTYLLEDNIVADQQVGSVANPSTVNGVTHNNVVIANQIGSESFRGKNIGNSFSEGEVVAEEFTINIPSSVNTIAEVNKEELKVAVVVWKGSQASSVENGALIVVK